MRPYILLITIVILLSIILFFKFKSQPDPMPEEDRVSHAYQSFLSQIQKEIKEKEITPNSFELHLRAYKAEALLEIWIKNKEQQKWTKLKEYPFCVNSGTAGPKRKEGDLQIPEGFYHIDRFNPKSKFYLSLGLNYPNEADLILGDPDKPGSDIFIHGGCQSVGCIAITDSSISELYVLASEVNEQGQSKIPVRVFPCRMDGDVLLELEKVLPEHDLLWKQLKVEDDYFSENKELKSFVVGATGEYTLVI